MLARSLLPAHFVTWNARTGAPFGGPVALARGNCSNRIWEYPWAFYATPLRPGMRALDIGGGLSGFPIVLALAGLDVVVVDPDTEARHPAEVLRAWSRHCGTTLDVIRSTLDGSGHAPDSFDVAFCLSVLEHVFDEDARATIVCGAWNLLKPGGLFVLTVDLDLHCQPFSDRLRAAGSQNVSIPEILHAAPFEMLVGEPSELLGCAGFDPGAVIHRAASGELLLGSRHVLSQGVVLRKRNLPPGQPPTPA